MQIVTLAQYYALLVRRAGIELRHFFRSQLGINLALSVGFAALLGFYWNDWRASTQGFVNTGLLFGVLVIGGFLVFLCRAPHQIYAEQQSELERQRLQILRYEDVPSDIQTFVSSDPDGRVILKILADRKGMVRRTIFEGLVEVEGLKPDDASSALGRARQRGFIETTTERQHPTYELRIPADDVRRAIRSAEEKAAAPQRRETAANIEPTQERS